MGIIACQVCHVSVQGRLPGSRTIVETGNILNESSCWVKMSKASDSIVKQASHLFKVQRYLLSIRHAKIDYLVLGLNRNRKLPHAPREAASDTSRSRSWDCLFVPENQSHTS